MKKKVSMFVWNNFLNDVRVLKEAQTLSSAGYIVTIFALRTDTNLPLKETIGSNISVRRVYPNPLLSVKLFLSKWLKKSDKNRNSARLESKQSNTSEKRLEEKNNTKKSQLLKIIARLSIHTYILFLLVKSRANIIHSHDVNTLPTCWFAARLSRAKIVYDAHEVSTDREGYKEIRNYIGWIEKKLMPRVDAAITTTNMRAKFFARAYKIPRPVVLQNRPRSSFVPKSDKIRDELLLEEKWPILVYQGGLQPGRGLPELIDVIADIPNVYLVLIGGGRSTKNLMSKVNSLNLSSRVKFIPTVLPSILPEYTASADIGVHPIRNTCLNHFTTDSNKLFEYFMAGLPIVITDFPEIRAVINQYNAGILVEPDSNLALKLAIQKMLQDDTMRQKFAQNTLENRDEISWERQEDRLVSLYEAVENS